MHRGATPADLGRADDEVEHFPLLVIWTLCLSFPAQAPLVPDRMANEAGFNAMLMQVQEWAECFVEHVIDGKCLFEVSCFFSIVTSSSLNLLAISSTLVRSNPCIHTQSLHPLPYTLSPTSKKSIPSTLHSQPYILNTWNLKP